VRKAGNRLRITAQLIKASNGYHLYVETFDRELKDVFEIQNEIAHSIARVLRPVLTSKDKISLSRFPTASVEAYDYCLRGRQEFYLFQRTGFERAVRLFGRAVRLDPGYAAAYAWLANCYSFLYTWFSPGQDVLEARRRTAGRRSIWIPGWAKVMWPGAWSSPSGRSTSWPNRNSRRPWS